MKNRVPEGLLSSDVPNIQLEFVVGKILNVEALCRRDGADVLNNKSDTSLERAFKMVVLPALSSPKTKMRSYYFFFFFKFLKMPIKPPPCVLLIDSVI